MKPRPLIGELTHPTRNPGVPRRPIMNRQLLPNSQKRRTQWVSWAMAALKYSPQRTGRPNARHVTKRSHTQYSRMVKSSLHDGRPVRIGQSSARRTSASNMGNSRDLKLVKKHEIRNPRNRHGQSRSELGGRSEEFIRRELLSFVHMLAINLIVI